jgi:hypothetical protein
MEMTNRLKEMGETASRRLLVGAAVKGATEAGYTLKRQPGRGLSNTWELSKDGKMKVASLRTTRDRWIAFPPLNGGKRWKTLDNVELVLVAAVDDIDNPQNVYVHLFPADDVRKRFGDSYAARIANGHTVRENFGMWVWLDRGDATIATQVGSGLAADYPAIARYSIDELEGDVETTASAEGSEAASDNEADEAPSFATVAEVLAWARSEIARLSGMAPDAIKLDIKIEA